MHAPARSMTARRTHCIEKHIRLPIVYSNKLGNVLRFRNSVDVLTGAVGEVLLAAVKSAPAASSTDRHRQAGSKYGTKWLNARLPGCQWQAPQLKHSSHSSGTFLQVVRNFLIRL
jgi:hypothetical protein